MYVCVCVCRRNFNLETLLCDPALVEQYKGCSVGIFRLAPQDYHRYHIPVDGAPTPPPASPPPLPSDPIGSAPARVSNEGGLGVPLAPWSLLGWGRAGNLAAGVMGPSVTIEGAYYTVVRTCACTIRRRRRRHTRARNRSAFVAPATGHCMRRIVN